MAGILPDDMNAEEGSNGLAGLLGMLPFGAGLARPIVPQMGPSAAPPPTFDMSPGFKIAKFGPTEIRYTVGSEPSGTQGNVEINGVFTSPDARGQGWANSAMQAFLQHTDNAGLTANLSIDPMERGITKGGLEDFYRSLGFVRNAGRNKDFSTRSGWIRPLPPTGNK